MGNTREHVAVRGIYGGAPRRLTEDGRALSDWGVNAVWIGTGGLTAGDVDWLRGQGARVYAEFNTLHDARFLESCPDAAPRGRDGEVCPPPDGWQGICPTHPAYRSHRMDAFRSALAGFEIDGIWLDYHHSHASWEQAVPTMPDTCFCGRCLELFESASGVSTRGPVVEVSRRLLGESRDEWVAWRCSVLTDWVAELRAIRDEVRPTALVGSYHCPWSDSDYDGALRRKLFIDLRAQSEHLDVLSPMPYHARFGHSADPEWVSRQVAWLGNHLGIRGAEGERLRIWPIVQLSDWGERVPPEQVAAVLDHGTRLPATGVMVFNWGGLLKQWANVEEMGRYYRSISGGGESALA